MWLIELLHNCWTFQTRKRCCHWRGLDRSRWAFLFSEVFVTLFCLCNSSQLWNVCLSYLRGQGMNVFTHSFFQSVLRPHLQHPLKQDISSFNICRQLTTTLWLQYFLWQDITSSFSCSVLQYTTTF